MTLVMHYFASQGSKKSFSEGIELGVMLWIGLGAPLTIISNAFDPHGTKLAMVIDTSVYLLIFVVQGVCVTYFHCW